MKHGQEEISSLNPFKYLNYLSAVVATVALSNPIQLIKTRLQTSPEHLAKGSIDKPYLSVIETANRIVNKQGYKGLFKGVSYFLMRTIPTTLGVFTVKEFIHRSLTRYVSKEGQQSIGRSLVKNHYFLLNSAIGGFAGFVIQIMLYPFEYLRIVFSNEIMKHHNSGLVNCIKQAFGRRGIAGIFNGVSMTLVYLTSARAVYFGLFDSYKNNIKNEYIKLFWSYISISIALLINYPVDTVRKRVIISPTKYPNGRACFYYMIKNQKISDFFSGWRITSIQGITYSIMLYLYDRMFTEILRENK